MNGFNSLVSPTICPPSQSGSLSMYESGTLASFQRISKSKSNDTAMPVANEPTEFSYLDPTQWKLLLLHIFDCNNPSAIGVCFLEPFRASLLCLRMGNTTLPFSYDEVSIEEIKKCRELQKEHLLPESAAKKIAHFIKNELKLDAKKFVLLKSETTSAIHKDAACINVSPELAAEIELDFNSECKFQIGHEIGHILNGDLYSRGIKILYLSNMASLVTTLFTTFVVNYTLVSGAEKVFSIIYPGSQLPLFPELLRSAYLIGCITGRVVHCLVKGSIRRGHEYEADLYSAKIAPEIAQAGMQYMEKSKASLAGYSMCHFPLFLDHPLPEERQAQIQHFV